MTTFRIGVIFSLRFFYFVVSLSEIVLLLFRAVYFLRMLLLNFHQIKPLSEISTAVRMLT